MIDNALTPHALQVSANRAEEMARRAFRLYVVAKHEYDSYIRQTDAIVGAIRDAATTHLERQKAAGVRTKQVTDGDVVAACAQLYSDAWSDVNDRRDKAKGMLSYLENLSQLARGRCYTVSNMNGASSKQKL